MNRQSQLQDALWLAPQSYQGKNDTQRNAFATVVPQSLVMGSHPGRGGRWVGRFIAGNGEVHQAAAEGEELCNPIFGKYLHVLSKTHIALWGSN